jgi:hypothetical protein
MTCNTLKRRRFSPTVSGLETRELLSNVWPSPQRITWSIMPDGTNYGWATSNLQSRMRGIFGSDWEVEIQKAVAKWQAVANVQLVQVADNGDDWGSGDAQQGDTRFGDIRIGGYNFGNSTLGSAFKPPPVNNFSIAGDIIMNTGQTWSPTNGTFSFETVMTHELGHALGLSHSSTSGFNQMYPVYNGYKPNLSTNDISSIQSLYGAYPSDPVNNGSTTNFTALSGSAISDISPGGDLDFYRFRTTGTTLNVTLEAMSALAPSFQLLDASGTPVGSVKTGGIGSTITQVYTGLTPSANYFVRVSGSYAGQYGLDVEQGRDDARPSVSSGGEVWMRDVHGDLIEYDDGTWTNHGNPGSPIDGNPQAVDNGAFVIADGDLWLWDGSWRNYGAPLGRTLVGTPAITWNQSLLFVRDSLGDINATWYYDTSHYWGTWSLSTKITSDLVIGEHGPWMVIFGTDTAGNISGYWTDWSNWYPWGLGNPGVNLVGRPSFSSSNIAFTARGSDGNLWEFGWDWATSTWVPWTNLGSPGVPFNDPIGRTVIGLDGKKYSKGTGTWVTTTTLASNGVDTVPLTGSIAGNWVLTKSGDLYGAVGTSNTSLGNTPHAILDAFVPNGNPLSAGGGELLDPCPCCGRRLPQQWHRRWD